MKYIITENQYKILTETDTELSFKRRAHEVNLRFFINKVVSSEPRPCEYFDDEFRYADDVIDMVAHFFLNKMNMTYENPKYERYYTILMKMCKEWFEEELIVRYRNLCQDNEM